MSFSNPEAFFLLAVVALFVTAAIFNYKKKKIILTRFISSAAFDKLGVRSGSEIDFFKTSLITLALIFFILALAGPQWGDTFENMEVKGMELVFLLDTSNSMNAEDLKPNRLEVAKQLIASIVDSLETDYVGLINFAGSAYIQCPLTIDYNAFKMMAEASVISPAEFQGTDFQPAFQLALKAFKISENEHKMLILITDGEDQEKRWKSYMPEIQNQKIIVFTVGIGVAEGAPIPVKDEQGNATGWKKDKQGNIVKTVLDENTLVQVASSTGGQYFRLTDPTAIDSFVKNLKEFERSVLKKKVQMKKMQRFHIPLIIGIILLLLEILLTEKRLSWKKS
jgi:Ca-activated chloride channel family protein